MKYITPNVPNIKITTNEEKEVLIDYVYEANIVTLNKNDTLILIEVPLSDTNMDNLSFDDVYSLNLNFGTMDLLCNDLESKNIDLSNMKMILKMESYKTGCAEKMIYTFYNGTSDVVYDIINTLITDKNTGVLEPLKMRIKYFEGATKLQKIQKGNWIDVFANKDVFVPVGERAMIPLGFALELPQGWEGHLAPRSSTFKTWGVIQTNHVGVVDDSYIGDNDQWHMPVYCLVGHKYVSDDEGNLIIADNCIKTEKSCELTSGTWIKKGDKIGQFRIMEVMPEIEFEEVESFENADRGGFGTSGTR